MTGRRVILGNDDVRLSYVAAGESSPYYRNTAGDECVFVESGRAVLESVFGALAVGAGDYVILPAGTTHRWLPEGAEALRAYCIESASHIRVPQRYLSATGQHLEQSPYCERDLRVPDDLLQGQGTEVDVYVKHRVHAPGGTGGSILTQATHPFDVVGWDGSSIRTR